MKNFTMITRHGSSKDNITAYTLISSNYQTMTMPAKDLAEAISNNKIIVNNMEVSNKGLVSTNGSLDKYTLINTQTNQVEGVARAVILDRVEQNGKLVGYTVFTQNGTLAELNIADAAALASKGLISNGKIRHTQEGDIVSAIGGNYPLRIINFSEAPKGEITVDILYFSTVVGTSAEYLGAIVSCTSATEMSQIINMLRKSNASIISEVTKVAGASAKESLSITRMGANSLYGVFSVDSLKKLIKANGKLRNQLGSITVSAIKYTNGEADEATVKVDSKWKVTSSDTAGSKAEATVKNYTKKIVTEFSGITIE